MVETHQSRDPVCDFYQSFISAPPTNATIIKEKVSPPVSSFNCHSLLDGQSSRKDSRATYKLRSIWHVSASLPPRLFFFRTKERRIFNSHLLVLVVPLVGTTGDISEKATPDERTIESRLYNSWDRPAFVVDGSTPVVPLRLSRFPLLRPVSLR